MNVPQKSTLLTPHDNPLLFLRTEFSPEAFIPKKFAVSGGGKGLSQELERLSQSAQKQCGDPYIATEIFSKLNFFPKEIRYVFLMHLIKNPFPDYPYSLVNLWKVIPMPTQKEDRGNFILILLELITSLSGLNVAWKDIIYQPTWEKEEKASSSSSSSSSNKSSQPNPIGGKQLPGQHSASSSSSSNSSSGEKNKSMKKTKTQSKPQPQLDKEKEKEKEKEKANPGYHATNSTPVCFHLPSTSPRVVTSPRLLLANLHDYKVCVTVIPFIAHLPPLI